MSDRRKPTEWLRYPRGWGLAVVYAATVAAIVGSVVLVTLVSELSVLAYVLFAASAVLLAYTVYTIVIYAPRVKRKIVESAQKRPFLDKLMKNYGFRTVLFAVGSTAVSIAYAVFNGVVAVVTASVWYGALCAYYVLLTGMRGGILFYHGRTKRRNVAETPIDKKIQEAAKYRNCGILLIVLPLCLSVAVWQMIAFDSLSYRAGLLIYPTIVYAFYKIIMAVYNMVKARANDDMTVRAIRNVNLADALVSVLAMQAAMLREFSTGGGTAAADAAMGAVVCALTAGLGLVMVVKGARQIRRCKQESSGNKYTVEENNI